VNIECSCCQKSVDETNSVRLLHKQDVTICFDCLNWLNQQRDRHERAHSGGWVVTRYEPVFVVSDMARAADHYSKLGFEFTQVVDGYAFAEHGGLNLHIELTEENGPRPGGGVLYIHCGDADEVAAEWRKAGLAVTAPENKPWGKYEGEHVDPDGNLIRFGSPPRRD
jgi:catechol 2,3-dioxygenase-like lactoylglutathione lyase family enzyme